MHKEYICLNDKEVVISSENGTLETRKLENNINNTLKRENQIEAMENLIQKYKIKIAKEKIDIQTVKIITSLALGTVIIIILMFGSLFCLGVGALCGACIGMLSKNYQQVIKEKIEKNQEQLNEAQDLKHALEEKLAWEKRYLKEQNKVNKIQEIIELKTYHIEDTLDMIKEISNDGEIYGHSKILRKSYIRK